jgi:hypothetical protein
MIEEQNKVMDVVVTSSCRNTIFDTFRSFFEKVKYSGTFRLIVNIDCCRPENLDKIVPFVKGYNIKTLNINYKPRGFTRAVVFVMKQVETPYFFHLEDDWVFRKEIDLDKYVDLMERHPPVNLVVFSKKKILYYNELFYLRKLKFIPVGYDKFKTENVTIGGMELVKSITYSTNPNISRTSHFKKLWYVNSRNIEQQFALQNFLLGNRRGYYIAGRIGEEATVDHIG